jgi:hypothetical protein
MSKMDNIDEVLMSLKDKQEIFLATYGEAKPKIDMITPLPINNYNQQENPNDVLYESKKPLDIEKFKSVKKVKKEIKVIYTYI